MIVFVSNYLNHHQLPFCKVMHQLTNGDFVFIATSPISEERLALGYQDMNCMYDFVLRAYESGRRFKDALRLCNTCDVLIYGSAPDVFFKERVKQKTLTFKYGERFFKTPFTIKNVFHRTASMLKHIIPYQNKNHYLLCASAYMPKDCALYGCFKNRIFKWGYFPEVKMYDKENLMATKKKSTLLWVGRMIAWKHPEYSILLADHLKKAGYDFHLKLIGTGEIEAEIAEMIKKLDLEDCVNLMGAMPADQVRQQMEQAEIFLFTSDQSEGWGAVLNESMNSGCAVVANGAIGSVPFLIKDGENGLTYTNGDFDQFYQNVVYLLEHPTEREAMGLKAYDTMAEQWNAKNAAERLLQLIDAIKLGHDPNGVFDEGVCSKAEIQAFLSQL